MSRNNYIADEDYDRLVDAILDLEPHPLVGQIDRCAIKVVLAEHANLFPMRMAVPIIEDEARDRDVDLKRRYMDTPANDSGEEDEAA